MKNAKLKNKLDGQIDFHSFVIMAKRRLALGISLAMLGYIVFALLSLYVLNTHFKASSTVIITNIKSSDGTTATEAQKFEITDTIAKNAKAILETKDIVQRALTSGAIRENAGNIVRNVTLSQVNDSHVLRITVTHKDADKVALIANELSTAICNEIQRRYSDVPVTATMLDKAATPSSRTKITDAIAFGLIGLIAGAIVFCFLIFRRLLKENAIRNIDRFCQVVNQNLLIKVPARERLLTGSHVDDPTRELIRTLRATVLHLTGGGKSIMVCSPHHKEGRTFVSSSLALSLSESGATVALLDANMRHSGIRSMLRIDSAYGLADVLNERVTLQQAMTPAKEGLMVISAASTHVGNPSALLCSSKMDAVLAELTASFDYVIIDTPNVNQYSDAVTLAAKVDCTILCIRHAVSRVDESKKAINTLDNAGANLIGLALIGSDN